MAIPSPLRLLLPILMVAAACHGSIPQAPEEPEATGPLELAATPKCGGSLPTMTLTPGGAGTNGTWFLGTPGNDVIIGTNGDDKIDGRSGVDVICGKAGNDSIRGDAGNDKLMGDTGNDVVEGAAGADALLGNDGDDTLDGGTQVDNLTGGIGADTLRGGDDKDKLAGDAGTDVLEGGNGDDDVRGGTEDDQVHGNAGRDRVYGNAGNDDLFGESGDDVLFGEAGDDDLDGGDGIDDCRGGGQAGDTRTTCELFLVQITSGYSHTCGLTSDGAAWCWGDDDFGGLGNGPGGSTAIPTAVVDGHSFQSLSAGGRYTCGVRTDGAAYCWGSNSDGQLGDNSAVNSEAPSAVAGGHSFQTVSASGTGFHTCGVRTDSAVYCWGLNGEGQLGDGNFATFSPTPVAIVDGASFESITVGLFHTCGVHAGGAAYCWGSDEDGQLGDGTAGGTQLASTAVSGGHAFQAVTAGSRHTCGVRTDGAGYCWGRDDEGELGDGSVGAPERDPTPGIVNAGPFSSLSGGNVHTCGLRTDRRAFCWGYDDNGQLGDGTVGLPGVRPTPQAVAGDHRFQQLSSGVFHTCAIRTDGAAFCWGRDEFGQLGDGTVGTPTNNPTPTPVIAP